MFPNPDGILQVLYTDGEYIVAILGLLKDMILENNQGISSVICNCYILVQSTCLTIFINLRVSLGTESPQYPGCQCQDGEIQATKKGKQ